LQHPDCLPNDSQNKLYPRLGGNDELGVLLWIEKRACCLDELACLLSLIIFPNKDGKPSAAQSERQ